MSNLRRMNNPSPSTGEVVDDPLTTLRNGDHDRYLQVLFAGANQREPLLALFLLNLELARVADLANEPMTGLIRLQWWRDNLARVDNGSSGTHPVTNLIAETGLVERLGLDALIALIDARERELDATPIATVDEVENHARATAGALNGAVAHLAGDTSRLDAAAAIGTAYGLLGIVRAVPFVLRRSQSLLPTTPTANDADDAEAAQASLRPVLRELAARARGQLGTVARSAPRRLASVMVPAVLARQDLARLARCDFDVFDGRLSTRPPWTVAQLLAATLTSRY